MSKFFSLAYLTLPNTHPVDQIEIAAQCGYEGVGLRTISQHLPGEPDYALANGRMFQMVRAALERTGVRLMDIELGAAPGLCAGALRVPGLCDDAAAWATLCELERMTYRDPMMLGGGEFLLARGRVPV